MKYTSVIAIMDDVPDSGGEMLSENVTIPENAVPVLLFFDNDKEVGIAKTAKQGNRLVAEIYLDEDKISKGEADELVGVIGGMCLKKENNVITEWRLESIGLTKLPSDKRLPKLKNNGALND